MAFISDFLFVTREAELASHLAVLCQHNSWDAAFARDFDEALTLFDLRRFKVIFIDIDEADLKGPQILEWIETRNVFALLGVFARKTYQSAFVNALKMGVVEFIPETIWGNGELLQVRLEQAILHFRQAFDGKVYVSTEDARWVGSDPVIRALLNRALSESGLLAPVHICGAGGSGLKELAKIVAAASGAKEIFWFHATAKDEHERKREFLEAVTNIPDGDSVLCISDVDGLDAQSQEILSECVRGEGLSVKGMRRFPRVKIVTTSKTDLELLVREGRFRQDLAVILGQNHYFVPPLSERKTDIPLLAGFFLERDFAPERVCYFSDDAMTALTSYDWPGNVAELKEMVQRVTSKVVGVMIKAKDLPAAILEKSFYVQKIDQEAWTDMDYSAAKRVALGKFNRDYLSDLLTRSNRNLTVAAEIAGMDRSNFKKIIKRYFPEDEL